MNEYLSLICKADDLRVTLVRLGLEAPLLISTGSFLV
jgi:hypothetical protein